MHRGQECLKIGSEEEKKKRGDYDIALHSTDPEVKAVIREKLGRELHRGRSNEI